MATTRPAAPVPADERIDAIDVLRGFALLGILTINIQWFSMIGSAAFNPTSFGDLTGANYLVWLLAHVFGELKFMAVFSMLFGAGIVLFSERIERRGGRPAGVHYRRMAWLIVFGLLHAYLVWHGDILYTYGMCGLVVFLFRRMRPWPLIGLGLATVAVSSGLYLLSGASMAFWPEAELSDLARDWAPEAAEIERELSIYRGGWLEQLPERARSALGMQLFVFFILLGPRAGGMMLIGMALFKWDVFSARRSSRFYGALVAAGLLVGLPLVWLGVRLNFAADWEITYSFFFGPQPNYWGSIPVALGWVGLVMLVCRRASLRRLTRPLAAVGRTALSNYLFQSLVCTMLFYGHGLGWFGHVDRTRQAGVVVAIWIVQLVVSPLWLRRFRFGPAEWLWRSLTYTRIQPLSPGRTPVAPRR